IVCFFIVRSPPISTLFPYTTLFRSFLLGLPRPIAHVVTRRDHDGVLRVVVAHRDLALERGLVAALEVPERVRTHATDADVPVLRSEEHTSELQSRENLVCRLLLEKK